ncbi:MAG: DMT family transporter [Ruminococcaceae bacterium]|nr:DMT family transporter [Oscillospiraceae bacterium]
MNKKEIRASLLLLVCAFVWGSTFVAQSSAAERVPTFTFLASRSFVGGGALLLIALWQNRRKPGTHLPSFRQHLLAGVLCGSALFVASACQQYGIALGTGAGKAGFLTALYLIFVPILELLLYRRSPGWITVCGSMFALVGLFLLCGLSTSGLHLATGDLFTALCGLCFAFHILIVDRFAPQLDGIKLSCIQFLVCGLLSLLAALLLEETSFGVVTNAYGSILYAGLFSSALGYTLQIIGQRDCPPTVATVLMSLESVFALLSETVIALLHSEKLPISSTELFGCLLMFVGVLLAQNPFRRITK